MAALEKVAIFFVSDSPLTHARPLSSNRLSSRVPPTPFALHAFISVTIYAKYVASKMVLLADHAYREQERPLFYQTHKLTIRQ